MAVLAHLDGNVGHGKSDLVKDIRAAEQGAGLKIDEQFIEANDRRGVLFLDFKSRHPERQHKGIELHLFDGHGTVQLIGYRRQHMRLDDIGNEKEPDERVDQ